MIVSFRRYEITLPTRYNDGLPIEPDKYLMTRREIWIVSYEIRIV